MADTAFPVSDQKLKDAHQALLNRAPFELDAANTRKFLQGVVLRGNDPSGIIRKAGLSPRVLRDDDVSIDGRQFQRLLFTLQGEMNDLFMGFMEQPGKLALERQQARVRFQCETLGEVVRVSTQFREAVRNDISYDYSEDAAGQVFTLSVDYRTVEGVDREIFHWHRLMSVYRYYSWLIGQKISLTEVRTAYLKDADASARRRYSIFDTSVKFGESGYSLSFDRKYLLRPILRKSESEHVDYAVDYPDWFLVPGKGTSWARQVEHAVIRLQDEGVWSPTISTVSAILSIGVRSLRRCLAEEGESFSQIKSKARRELAIAYLLTTDLPITSIADIIGFGEPGDFTRAFLGWMGMTPSSYRSTYRNNKDMIMASASRLRETERIKR